MLDSKILTQQPETLRQALQDRGLPDNTDELLRLRHAHLAATQEKERLAERKNTLARQIGQAKGQGLPDEHLVNEATQNSELLEAALEKARQTEETWHAAWLTTPNIPDESTPKGQGEDDNPTIRHWGEAKTPEGLMNHIDWAEKTGFINFEEGTKLAKSRFCVLHHDIARLARALKNLMLDTHAKAGYLETGVPFITNTESLTGTGQLPKFEEELFRLERDNLYLIPTAEVPLTNLFRDRVLDAKELPVRLAAYSPCFRREAGSAGKDTRGMIRQHQFEKVEIFQLVLPEESPKALEELTAQAESILQMLEIPYRVVSLCTADIGFSSSKTYDLEAWLPGQGKYREISSCSNFKCFQTRRMNTRIADGKRKFHPHTLNGSGLAIGRTIVALIENHMLPDGSIRIPESLKGYMQGQDKIRIP